MADAYLRQGAMAPVLVVGTHSVHVRRFVAGLCEAGQTVVLATDGADRIVDHDLLLDQILVNFSMHQWNTGVLIAQFARQWSPRVIHAHQANSVAWHAARAAHKVRLPLVLTLWGSDVLVTPHQGFWKRRMVQQALRAADVWTADASELLKAARELIGQDKPGVLIPMGLEEVPARLDMLWPEKGDWLLSCRLHKPLYRVDAIIRSFAEIASKHPSWRLEVAASGGETAALSKLAKSSEAISFSGYLSAEALRASYLRTQVYLSFPVSDGTSVSLLEAMSMGCFPIVSDVPANREWIVDRLNGLVVDQATDLAAAIEEGMLISQSTQWREVVAPANLQLVRDKALFSNNIQQFLAQHRGLEQCR